LSENMLHTGRHWASSQKKSRIEKRQCVTFSPSKGGNSAEENVRAKREQKNR